MITILRLELLRVARDRRFWFIALIGVPILLPAAVLLFAFALASTATVEPQAVRPVVATTEDSPEFLEAFAAAGLPTQVLSSRSAVANAIQAGTFSVGVVDVVQEPDEPMSATLLANIQARQLPVYRHTERVLSQIAADRRQALMDDLDFVGSSFDLLVDPLHVAEERVPERLPAGLTPLVTLIWSLVLVFPYLLLTFNGGSKLLTDRLEGYLSPINASTLPAWQWLIARWLALSAVGAVLLVYSAFLLLIYLRAYAAAADVLVAQGVLTNLSEAAALGAQAYLVDMVAMWRGASLLSYLLWLTVAVVQMAGLCALLIWGAARSASLAQFRLFELVPFMLIFIVPMMGLGALGTGLGSASWIPGLNVVLSIEHVVAGGWPGSALLTTLAIAMVTNLLFIALCLTPAALAMRRERLWSA